MNPDELLAQAAPVPEGPYVVALSGGPDSAVAAWLVARLGVPGSRAIHVNHGTRAAAELEAAARAVGEMVGLATSVVSVTVEPGPSWEAAARKARWKALETKAPDDCIVTGHHRDDLAETTLAHLLRGAGARGLGAMYVERSRIWRPLLGVRRDAIRTLADKLELPYVDDPSNSDPAHTRNLLRHRVLPTLSEALDSDVIEPLARAARTLAADDALLEGQVPADCSLDAWGAIRLPVAAVVTAPAPLAARMVRRLLRAARPPYAGTEAEVRDVLAVAGELRTRVDVSGGVTVEREGPWLVAHRGVVAAPDPVGLQLPGRAHFGRLEVIAEVPAVPLVRRTALVDSAVVGGELRLRSAAPGERIEIRDGTKLVRDVFAEADIPARLRSAWPVAEAHGRIAAVVGIRSAPWARGARGEPDVYELRV